MNKTILIIFLLTITLSFSQTKRQIEQITKNYDIKWLNDFSKIKAKEAKGQKDEAITQAKINNWPITYIGENGSYCEIQKIENGKPIYYSTNNIDAAISTRTNFLHNGGGLGLDIEGQGMTAYVWDGGLARSTHVEFNINGQSKITSGDSSSYVLGHATHVAGTIAAIGVDSNAKGMAPQANIISADWNYDLSEVTIAASNGMLISNHSYGAVANFLEDWQFGAYTLDCKDWDNLLFNAPYYLLVSAAGNDGNDNVSNGLPLDGNSNYDKLSQINVAKNPIVVSNANDAYVNSNGDIVSAISLNSSSSQGPTDDYRIKPDLTGNGTGVYSPVAYQDEQVFDTDPTPTIPSDTDYRSWQGTSMASPNIAGSLLLLQQLYYQQNGQFALSATIKGLALHTADDGGDIGPDAKFGWGYMNTKKAAEIILNTGNSITEELTLNENETYSFEVVSDGTNPLIASISWTDPAPYVVNYGTANLNTPYLVNDLDIRITKNGTTYYPWKLTSVNTNTKADNIVDPYEKIEIESAIDTYTVTISHKGSLRNNLQNYSLIITGIIATASTIDENIETDFDIYPNPTNGIIKIAHNSNLEYGNIKIFTIQGKEVYNLPLNNQSFQDLDLRFLETGVYYISLFKNNLKTTKKLIIK